MRLNQTHVISTCNNMSTRLEENESEAHLGVQGCEADIIGALGSPQQQVLVVHPARAVHKSISLAIDDGGVVCRTPGLQLRGFP